MHSILVAILVVVVALISLTEYACRILPTANSKGIIDGLRNGSTFSKGMDYPNNYASTIVLEYAVSLKNVSMHPILPGNLHKANIV
jgi:hypothetical protein